MSEQISTNRTVTTAEAKSALRKCFKVGRPIFIWGPPGIGKSDIVHQVGDEQDREVIDIRLSLWEPTDIKGIPFYNPESHRMEWAPPIDLPSDPESTAILFLDELNSAAPATQAAAYQLILNRRIGSYVLPEGVSIVAAGNRESDKGVTYRMPAPLANRFVHIELRVSADEWQTWAIDKKVHEQVVGYIGFAKQDLYDFNPRSSSRAFATPRSWVYVSQFLDNDDISDNVLTDLVAGAIGDGLAVKFMAHRKVAGKMPRASDILAGSVKKLSVKEISAIYSLTISLCYELHEAHIRKEKGWFDMADNFFSFMMDNFPTELVVMGAKVALMQYSLPIDPSRMKSFDAFYEKYGRYVITAAQG